MMIRFIAYVSNHTQYSDRFIMIQAIGLYFHQSIVNRQNAVMSIKYRRDGTICNNDAL